MTCISINAHPLNDHKQTHTQHIHAQLLSTCLHHSPRSPDFCPIRAFNYPVGKAAAMVMVDGSATAGFLACHQHSKHWRDPSKVLAGGSRHFPEFAKSSLNSGV